MKNPALLQKLKDVSRKNLTKAFASLFVLVMLMSAVSAFFGAGALILFQKKTEIPHSLIFAYLLLFAGIFLWFLLLNGFLVMLYRMVKEEYVTFGYLFYGFRRFSFSAPSALLCTFLTAVAGGLLALAVKLISLLKPEVFESLADKASSSLIFFGAGGIFLIFILVFLFPQVFLVFVRCSNPAFSVFKAALVSARLSLSNFFSLVRFILRAGGRNLVLASFYFGATLTFQDDAASFLFKLLNMVFGFLYFINIYKAITLMFLSLPVFYDDLVQPKIEIIVSLKKDEESE